MHKGLLFDLDGVIVDTAQYHYIAWKELANELGIKFTLEDNERLKGVSRNRSFEIILEIGQKQMSKEEKNLYCEKKNEVYLTYINKLTQNDILPGVSDFLKQAKRKGYKIALGSASKNSKIILEGLQITGMFDEIVDGTNVFKAKPDPEVFMQGAQRLGLAYSDCIVFEDAVAGIEAAHLAGMKAVGVGSKELLPKADTNILTFLNLTIEELEEILVYL